MFGLHVKLQDISADCHSGCGSCLRDLLLSFAMCCASGYFCRRLRLAALRSTVPETTSARGCGVPSRAMGLPMVASTATCAPCQDGSPLQTTSMRRASWTGTWRFFAANLTFLPTRSPASASHSSVALVLFHRFNHS